MNADDQRGDAHPLPPCPDDLPDPGDRPTRAPPVRKELTVPKTDAEDNGQPSAR
jgi:hypothetical protein